MERESKHRLFASCVARTLEGQLAFDEYARPQVEATVERLAPDFGASVRSNSTPVWSASLLWARLPKAQLLEVARTTLGEAWTAAHAKRKKAEIAEAMQIAFDAPGRSARGRDARGPGGRAHVAPAGVRGLRRRPTAPQPGVS